MTSFPATPEALSLALGEGVRKLRMPPESLSKSAETESHIRVFQKAADHSPAGEKIFQTATPHAENQPPLSCSFPNNTSLKSRRTGAGGDELIPR